ncbi:hypothetical protein TSAR_005507 [Trichomalopsis sarcophagae]|uniref:Uncharacterized protein n=1 Tax=Trichomalopsis sarcophagae TaxID=543379 RepID=A0A232F2L3_9HYME|nr:hypothetical protein TSAR_005507 [Trichomalopsis sarcophagae]
MQKRDNIILAAGPPPLPSLGAGKEVSATMSASLSLSFSQSRSLPFRFSPQTAVQPYTLSR